MRKTLAVIIAAIIITASSCKPQNEYPNEPIVKFEKMTYADTTILNNHMLQGTLKFSFTDGDGDIGFDTTGNTQNTIFMTKYKMQNGSLVPLDLAIELNYFVNRVFKSDKKQAINGEMQVNDLNEFEYSFGDTIMYKFYIVDRAGNRSNTDSTGLIVIEKNLK